MPSPLHDLCMSPSDLRTAGITLFGDTPGWQSRLAENLGVDRSAVTRWLSGTSRVPLQSSLLLRYILLYGTPEIAFRKMLSGLDER